MRTFGTMEKLREATLEELSEVPQMNERAAESVYEFLHKNGS